MKLALCCTVALLGSPATRAQSAATLDRVHHCVPEATGLLSGGVLELETTGREGAPRLPASMTTILSGSPTTGAPGPASPATNVFGLVFVGDGYTAAELGSYANHVDAIVAGYFAVEPYATYASYFAVHRVDVISNESGVDNDPLQGISKDTALDMTYWCNNTERLLCVNTNAAWSYAANAPQADHLIAIANSSKYGGAGYSSADIAIAPATTPRASSSRCTRPGTRSVTWPTSTGPTARRTRAVSSGRPTRRSWTRRR